MRAKLAPTLCALAVVVAGGAIAGCACGGSTRTDGADGSTPRTDSGVDAGRDARAETDRGAPSSDARHEPDADAGAPGCGVTRASDGGCGDAAGLMTDPANCGACGHGCDGGACRSGACVPLPAGVLVTGLTSSIVGLAVDDTSVYWLTHGAYTGTPRIEGDYVDGEVMKCAIGGCDNRPTVLAHQASQQPFAMVPSSLTLAGSVLYWVGEQMPQGGGVYSCAAGGCGCSPLFYASGQGTTTGVTATGGQVYFTDFDVNRVESCATTGCVGTPHVLSSAPGGPEGITFDSTYLYWTDYGGAIVRCGLPDCASKPTVIWHAQPGTSEAQTAGIVVDATNLYWTNGQPEGFGSVMQCAKGDCEATQVVLASKRSTPWGIAVDGTDVYWNESGVYRCAIGGCGDSPTMVAPSSGQTIAVDATRLYFSVEDSSLGIEIVALPK